MQVRPGQLKIFVVSKILSIKEAGLKRQERLLILGAVVRWRNIQFISQMCVSWEQHHTLVKDG